jgi:putative PIG3 family NAD(P)H quinone oxidoreductase
MSVPATMKFVQIATPGGPEVLQIGTRTTPKPAAGEALVKVAAAGLNHADLMQRGGKYPPPPGASDIMGLELSGTIAALGDGVTGWKVGDQVCALLAGGGYAEYCAVPAPQLMPVPKGLSMVEAAGVPEAVMTVWTNVFDRGRLKAGETFLVHGGSSGIGTWAIQLAKHFGARVFTTAGTAEKCAFCVKLGAERAINYKTEDFETVMKEVTGGKSVDLTLDMVAGDYIQKNIAIAKPDGRIVCIATQKSTKAEINIGLLMRGRLTLTGSTLRPRPVTEKGEIAMAMRKHVWPLIEAGKVKPIIHATFPFARAAEAHRMMEASTHIGKIVLTAE